MEDFFDKVLHYYGRKGEKLFMINIGAMDGVLFDGMSGYADMYNSDVLYVEPMKPHFDRLVKHKGDWTKEKCKEVVTLAISLRTQQLVTTTEL